MSALIQISKINSAIGYTVKEHQTGLEHVYDNHKSNVSYGTQSAFREEDLQGHKKDVEVWSLSIRRL